ncbi:MAG: SDR family NAD(P)-dependent oxidoreductase [Bryobacteraceae bacterium]
MLAIDLSDKVALVTGGSRGIGAAITKAMCDAGAYTVFTHTGRVANRQPDEPAEGVVLDGRDGAGATALVNHVVKERGSIDILVTNVGRNLARPAEQVTDDEWRDFLDINLGSAFYAVRAVLPHMLRAGYGRIILIGSSVVYDGGGGAIDYAAGKSGLTGIMLYLARTYARKGILTNLIHPCVIDTDLLRERYSDEAKRARLAAQIPVGRLGRPEDIAGLAVYLASSWGNYICGQAILVDGGRTLFR